MLKLFVNTYLKSTRSCSSDGFTLIELMTVILIVGILSALALPSLLSNTGRARQAEAKSNIGIINRSQQAYYLEKNEFASSLPELGLDIPSTTNNYQYTLSKTDDSSPERGAAVSARPLGTYKAYLGAVRLVEGTNPSIRVGVCESNASGSTVQLSADEVRLEGGEIKCPAESVTVK